jgi:5-hydroxyisourate hydrolase
MSAVTTHVLDAALGRPAVGVAVRLERLPDLALVAEGHTDSDGRISALGPDQLPDGVYRLVFGTGEWFSAEGRATFYPEVAVTFSLTAEQAHHHVPLLLSPFAYTTYRGS